MEESFSLENVKIREIIVLNASINNQSELTSLENPRMELKLTFSAQFSDQDNELKLLLAADIKASNKKDPIQSVDSKFELAFFYTINNLKDFVRVDGKRRFANHEILVTLADISYNTARGIIFTRCNGTILSKVIMPVQPRSRFKAIFEKENLIGE